MWLLASNQKKSVWGVRESTRTAPFIVHVVLYLPPQAVSLPYVWSLPSVKGPKSDD